MTTIGIQIGWLAIRVTLFALCAAALASWSARRAARSAVIVLAAAMVIVIALSAATLFPAPDYRSWMPLTSSVAIRDAALPKEFAANDEALAGGFTLPQIWTALGKFSQQKPTSTVWQNGSALLVGLYALGIAVAGWRLASAWLAIQALRRRSASLLDAKLLGFCDALREAVGCRQRVELRECDEPGLAATIGAWRPVIFLPPDWRQWTDTEIRSVLAHELAHVRHGDYLSGFLTRICQALHFYHPLVYWLSNQLRWQQELAADDLAASALAEKSQYVKSLARLALRSPARTPAAAMPYSAITGGALLRRIEMLREPGKSRPLGWRLRGLLIAALAGVGLLLSSFGAHATPTEPPVGDVEPFELGYLPSYARGFLAIRPSFVMEQPGMDSAKTKLADGIRWLGQKGITVPDALRPENIEQIVMDAGLTSEGAGGAAILGSSSMYIRLKQEFDWPRFIKNLAKEIAGVTIDKQTFEVKEIQDEGVTNYNLGKIPLFGPGPVLFSVVDRRSVVFCSLSRDARGPGPVPDAKYLRQLVRNAAQARERDWGSSDKAARAPIAYVLDNHDGHYSKTFAKNVPPALIGIGALENVRFTTVVVEIGDGRPVRLILDTKSATAAGDVQKQVAAVFDKEMREGARTKPASNSDKVMAALYEELYRSRKVDRQGERIEWLGYSSVRVADFIAGEFVGEKDARPEANQPKR